jgi:hypothetical protein
LTKPKWYLIHKQAYMRRFMLGDSAFFWVIGHAPLFRLLYRYTPPAARIDWQDVAQVLNMFNIGCPFVCWCCCCR